MTSNENTRDLMIAAGTTDDVTTCECCGRSDLKSTVRMIVLDPDGNRAGEQYYGSECAAKASGRPVGEIRREARAADRAADEALAREAALKRAAAHDAQWAAYEAWWTEAYGTADRDAIEKATGKSPFTIWGEASRALAS